MGRGDGLGGEENFQVTTFDSCQGGACVFLTSCLCCGFVLNYLVAEKIGQNALLHGLLALPCWPFVGTIPLRMRTRTFLGVDDNRMDDVLCGLFCWPCAQCQMYNELKERGVD